MKQLIVELIDFVEKGSESDAVKLAVDRWGSENIHWAASSILFCLIWQIDYHKFGRIELSDSEGDLVLRQWIIDEPQLSDLFAQSGGNTLTLRKGILDNDRAEIQKIANAYGRRNVDSHRRYE